MPRQARQQARNYGLSNALARGNSEPRQECRRWLAVGRQAELGLQLADNVALREVEATCRLVHLTAELPHLALQRHAGVARDLRVVSRPRSAESAAAPDAIGEVAGRQGIEIG